jgi:hypothetical protein
VGPGLTGITMIYCIAFGRDRVDMQGQGFLLIGKRLELSCHSLSPFPDGEGGILDEKNGLRLYTKRSPFFSISFPRLTLRSCGEV